MAPLSKELSDDALLIGGFAVFLLAAALAYLVPAVPYTTATYWLGGIAVVFVIAYVSGSDYLKVFVAVPIRVLLAVFSLTWLLR